MTSPRFDMKLDWIAKLLVKTYYSIRKWILIYHKVCKYSNFITLGELCKVGGIIYGAFNVKWNHFLVKSDITDSNFDENWLTYWRYGQKKNM